MKPSDRKSKKWRKKSPMIHRSFAEKRDRSIKHVKDEIKKYSNKET
jgi:hypothetical protein